MDDKITFPKISNCASKNQINKIIVKYKIKYEMNSYEFFNWNNKKINIKIFKKYYKQKHLTNKIIKQIAYWVNLTPEELIKHDKLKINYDTNNLNCSDNKIYNLDLCFDNKLLRVNCSKNKLKKILNIPDNLIWLDLSYNDIDLLELTINKLVYLNCSGNKIKILPEITKLFKSIKLL